VFPNHPFLRKRHFIVDTNVTNMIFNLKSDFCKECMSLVVGGFEVLKAVTTESTTFRHMTPFSRVEFHRRLEKSHFLDVQGRNMKPSKF
jgi:hypothetical protein